MNSAHLVEEIEKKVPLSPATRAAFLAIDRKLFVPQHYRQVERVWTACPTTDGEVYQDIPLVTKVERGRPCSSSSQPSVMAAVIEALQLQPGQSIMEIGTGTGYNAALLAHITGDAHLMTSLDIDGEAIEHAQQIIPPVVGEGMTMVQADGRTGYEDNAPYDRIMVAAGFRHVPDAWRDQLKTGGLLVGNWLRALSSVMVVLQKQEDGSMKGSVLPQGAFFMEMRPTEHTSSPPDWTPYDAVPKEEHYFLFDMHRLLSNQAFLLLLQCRYPELQKHARPNTEGVSQWIINPATFSSLAVSKHDVVCRGKLLSYVYETYQQWLTEDIITLEGVPMRIRPSLEPFST
jgi:protein-L-isoaspartate(D-aspartate) O-methyltransferase